MIQASGRAMGRATLNIVLSLAGAGILGFGLLVLLETVLGWSHPADAGAAFFRFQVISMIATAAFAGFAIVIYVRLTRISPGRPKRWHDRQWPEKQRPEKKRYDK